MSTETPIHREHQYTAIINVRNTELAAYWTRYNIQAVLNVGLLAAIISAKSDSIIVRHQIIAVVGGLILSFIWLLFAIKGKHLITKRWDKHIREYEKEVLPGNYNLFEKVEAEEEAKKGLHKHWDNLNILARVIPILLMVGWLLIGFDAYRHPPIQQREQNILELNNNVKELISERDRINLEIDQLKTQVKDFKSDLQRLSILGKEKTNPGKK